MKKIRLVAIAALCVSSSALFAGGLLTNTNQSVHFLRNPARDASTEIDAVYTNPAGLVKLADGLHFSFNNQSAFQTRTITSTSALFPMNGGLATQSFEGKASVPIIPSLQGAYKKGKWVLSGSIAISGGGGKATFDRGLPSFESLAAYSTQVVQNAKLKANHYEVNQYMKGANMIIGTQLGGTYKINDMFSAYAGFRLNIVSNSYEGYLRGLKMNLTPMTNTEGFSPNMVYADQALSQIADGLAASDPNKENAKVQSQVQNIRIMAKASSDEGAILESKQSGWGVAPILGFNFNYQDKLNIGVKYEFKTALDLENDTKRDDTGMFADGVNTASDIPALLTIGASYNFTDKLQASLGYHRFFDSNAGMSGGKEKHAGSTNEYLAGIEYKINDMFLISAGGQITDYGVEDDYQSDLSFACSSYSLGLGGAVQVSPTVRINLGYFWTTYSDYSRNNTAPDALISKDVFARTNKVFGAGVDFSF